MAYKAGTKKRTVTEEASTETSYELDLKKQVTVREYNGVKLVDIREFYIDKASNEKKPGKKGIALTQETWKKLMELREEIDGALGALDAKKRKVAELSESAPLSDLKRD